MLGRIGSQGLRNYKEIKLNTMNGELKIGSSHAMELSATTDSASSERIVNPKTMETSGKTSVTSVIRVSSLRVEHAPEGSAVPTNFTLTECACVALVMWEKGLIVLLISLVDKIKGGMINQASAFVVETTIMMVVSAYPAQWVHFLILTGQAVPVVCKINTSRLVGMHAWTCVRRIKPWKMGSANVCSNTSIGLADAGNAQRVQILRGSPANALMFDHIMTSKKTSAFIAILQAIWFFRKIRINASANKTTLI